jgi:3-hydroxyisobutyrate dehydrogenase-like beta-hydroxyacid dehydrogenase
MGAAVAAQVRSRGASVLWCSAGRSTSTAQRAAEANLEEVQNLDELLNRAEVVLSICPPTAAEDIARAVAGHGYAGIFVEANAISPGRCGRIVTVLQDVGTRVVDGAIFGPPPTNGASVRIYLAGEPSATRIVDQLFAGTTVQPVIVGERPPVASALKIADASYHKAARALAAVAHALAAEYGVTEHLLSEAGRIEGSPLTDLDYLPSVAARAWRWAPEMLEVADALAEVGLPPELALAAQNILGRWQADKDDWHLSLPHLLQQLKVGPTTITNVTAHG